jgi:hemerythrin
MRITWSTNLETGIRSIDLQHQELIGMLNELDAAHTAGGDQALLADVLQRLDAYVAFHFGTEESLMASLPRTEQHTEEHLRQHYAFIEQLHQMRALAKQENPQVMLALIDYLNAWLYEHILKTDRSLGALLNSQTAKSLELSSRLSDDKGGA